MPPNPPEKKSETPLNVLSRPRLSNKPKLLPNEATDDALLRLKMLELLDVPPKVPYCCATAGNPSAPMAAPIAGRMNENFMMSENSELRIDLKRVPQSSSFRPDRTSSRAPPMPFSIVDATERTASSVRCCSRESSATRALTCASASADLR
jgi:hypothetical protein